ncbi:hypothetical protein [Xanthomonas phage Carpasina]|uniref:Uncharacterized protein n=1 Tax=Xanthomonas phage Carpasina TaxID=2163636 RepID=A0A2S1GSS3_9CAUD|nr:hypothetical protein HOT16_gp38 [Xanthomonas phage Carpasina]AWD92433.1 hypothetical protein [Xanthomonas phage Carpasina]
MFSFLGNLSWPYLAGGILLVIVLVVAALYLAGLGGVVRIVGAVFGFLGDSAQSLRVWLRRPGSKMKALRMLGTVAFIITGLIAWRRGEVIADQQVQYINLKTRAEEADKKASADRQILLSQMSDRDKAISAFMAAADRQKELLDAATRASKDALRAVEAEKKRASASAKKYQSAFDDRPEECKAALSVMEKACPTLENY